MTHVQKQLSYSSLDELEKMCQQVDFKSLDFNKPGICNSLLKMLDKADKYLEEDRDDERAYIMYMRFFEGILLLRKSRIYKDDRKFVDSMITQHKLNDSMTRLERLKDELKMRYEKKLSLAAAQAVQNQSAVEENNEQPKVTLVSVEKKFLNPKELVSLLTKAVYYILIIDARSKTDFERSHMAFNLILTTEKQRRLVSYINIPPECIQNVSWSIYDALRKEENGTEAASTFALRYQFDYLVLFDRDGIMADSKLSVLKRALYDYDQEPCKNEPLILEGGWKQWIIYYPTLVSSLMLDSSSADKSPPSSTFNKIDKLFDFDYPEISHSKTTKAVTSPVAQLQPQPQLQLTQTNKPTQQQPQASPVNVNDEIKPEPIETEKSTTEAENVQKADSNSLIRPAERPTIDRSNKPEHKSVETPSSVAPPSFTPPKKPSVASTNFAPQSKPILQSQPNAANSPSTATSTVGTVKKSEIGDTMKNTPNSLSNNLDDVIYNTVYAPTRSVKPIQTPYMQQGSTKVLNSETGLFFYNPPPAVSAASAVAVSAATANTRATMPSQPPASARPATKKFQPVSSQAPPQQPSDTDNRRATAPSSNLKRTYSSPNIAKLDDELEKLDIDDANEKETIIRRDFGKIDTTKTVVANKPMPKAATAKLPSVNRNNKPMPEHIVRARIDDLQPVFGNAHPGLIGIRNLGNTCFMNSIIQCLSSTEPLVRFFLEGRHRQDLNRSNELGFGGEIADEFSVIIRAMWSGHCRIISPRRFKQIIGQFNQQFVSNEQQDAQELLLFLLDGLHEDLNRVVDRPKINNKNSDGDDDDNLKNLSDQQMAAQSWNTHLSINNSIIVDLFQGQFKSTVRCLSCGKNSIKFDAFMYLTLPLPSQKCNIYQCLETFLQPEKMSGESKWKCPQCKVHREAVKKIDIWRLPPLLIIHLKRFKYHGLWRDKITTPVDYPVEENLNLDRYIINRTAATSNYRLYAVSNHSGTLDGGHYTAVCKHFEYARWFKFDDIEVKEVTNSSSALTSPLSYILFYKRS